MPHHSPPPPPPPHTHTNPPNRYEVRAYPTLFVAEVANAEGDNSQAFRTLAKYIGVFSSPANTQRSTGKAESISMTAPVVMPQPSSSGEAISMTAPVMMSGEKMQFIMPDKYTTLDSLPQPTDPRVQIREVPAKVVGVIRYSGKATNVMTAEKVAALKGMLEQETLLPKDKKDVEWEYCGYDPPFTPGPFRRNEAWIKLGLSEAEVTKKLAEVDAATCASK